MAAGHSLTMTGRVLLYKKELWEVVHRSYYRIKLQLER